MSTRKLAALVSVGVLAGSAAACGSSGDAGAGGSFDPSKCSGGTLRVLEQASLDQLDPARLYTSGGGREPTLLFRSLTTRTRKPGPDGIKVTPDLATDTGKPNADSTVWTYHLRSGLKFDNGKPITSADVKYGIERSFAANLPGGAPYLHDWLVGGNKYRGPYKDPAGLKSIETPDAKTIVFHLKSPHGDFPYLATATQFAPVPKANDTGTSYSNKPVSSGPYKVKSYQKSKSLTLVRNKYWSRSVDPNRLACPDQIDITSGLDASVINQRLAASSGDDANAITTDTPPGPAELSKAANDPNFARRVVNGRFPDTHYLAFDTTKAPFKNIKVREAIDYAIDRQSLVEAAGGGKLAYTATTWLPNSPGFGYQPYDFYPAGATGNPKKAKQLLAEAGFKHGLTITLAHRSSDSNADGPSVATAVQDALRKAGITVKLQSIEEDDYSTTVDNPKTQPQVAIASWGADWPSGGPFIIPIFDGRQYQAAGGNFNLAHLKDPKVNAEIDKINKVSDPAQAAQKWGALDKELGKRALYVPLFHTLSPSIVGSHVKNAWASQWNGTPDLSVASVR